MQKFRIYLAIVLAVLMTGGGALAAPRKLRVTDPALAAELTARGGRVVADYGGFEIIETEDAALAGAATNRAELKDEFDFIQLNAGSLDTRAPAIRALRRAVSQASGRRLHLVHFAGPIKPEWHAAVEATGARIVSYIPHNAYLVNGDATALGRLQAWAATNDFVQWEGRYADDYKIHPRARVLDAQGRPQTPPTDTFVIQLLDDADVNANTLALIDGLKLEAVQNESRVLHFLNLVVRLPAERLAEIAARPDVISIQPCFARRKFDERQDQILAGILTGTAPSGPGYLAWLASKGFTQAQFTASGFVVDISDSGIDGGTTTPGHFGLYQNGNSASPSRVAYTRRVGRPNRGSTLQGCDGHGTLNAHIVAGYNDLGPGFPHADAAGFRYGLGLCPFVKVGTSVIFDPDSYTNPNFASLQSQAYRSGARISNNSWGADTGGIYDADAQAYDALVRDAQPPGSSYPTTGNQPMVIVFASGNAGPSTQTVGSPGSAKNVITVGAAESVRSLSPANGGNDAAGGDGCGMTAATADSADDITTFSSRGPCSDGRMKPDLVAPGTHITGGVAQTNLPPSPAGTGLALACFDGGGVCALLGGGTTGNPDNFFPLGQQFYTVSSGTSHATPAVSGACALVRQYFINQGLAAPSPAMTKAVLMNSARYLTGASAGDTLWSPNQGMGEVNLGTAFDGVPRSLRDQTPVDKFTATGQTRTFTGSVANPAKPFRVTLAWTDAPGSTVGNAFNNDLDLVVTVGGLTYKGNVFNGAFSTTGGTADSQNNVESVFLPAGVSGNFVVTVTAANINSDGVPNEAPSLDQDFALVIYNTPASADVGVGETISPAAVNLGAGVTIRLNVTNLGPVTASNVIVTDALSAGLSFVSASTTRGTITNNAGVIATALGVLTNGATAAISIQATATAAGAWTNTANISADTPDAVSANNRASAIVSVNSPPTLSAIPDVATAQDTPAGPIPFSIGDAEKPASALTLSAASSNPGLVPVGNIVFSGSDSNRTVTLTPRPGQFGAATITVTVSDGLASTNTSFNFSVNGLPTLAAISDQTLVEGMTLTFTAVASDADGDALSFSLEPSVVSGAGTPAGAAINPTNGVFTWTPTAAQVGTNDFTVRVTDNGSPPLSVAQSFTVIVLESNRLPVLVPIADQTIHAQTTLVLTNSATDPNLPAQVLTFGLDAGAADGASLDPANGVFTWTPLDSQTGTNAFTVRVTDNGLPNLSDAKTFSVIVRPRPTFETINVLSNGVTLSWSAIPGATYRVQFADSVTETNWTDLSPDVVASGTTTGATDTTATNAWRFYRVRVVP